MRQQRLSCLYNVSSAVKDVWVLMQALATGEDSATVADFMNVKAESDLISF